MLVKLPPALDAQLQRDSGLSYMEYMVLAMLSEQPDRILRMSELAGAINASLSRLSHIARRLERQQLITREPDPTDGRSTNAVLTDEGWPRWSAAPQVTLPPSGELVIDALTAEQLLVCETVGDQIMDRIEPGGGRSAGRGRRLRGEVSRCCAGGFPHRTRSSVGPDEETTALAVFQRMTRSLVMDQFST